MKWKSESAFTANQGSAEGSSCLRRNHHGHRGAVGCGSRLQGGEQVSVLVNGLGATPLEELYIVYRKVNLILSSLQVKIHRSYIGEFATSLEMAGCSITLLKLDEELKPLLDAPAASPFFLQV